MSKLNKVVAKNVVTFSGSAQENNRKMVVDLMGMIDGKTQKNTPLTYDGTEFLVSLALRPKPVAEKLSKAKQFAATKKALASEDGKIVIESETQMEDVNAVSVSLNPSDGVLSQVIDEDANFVAGTSSTSDHIIYRSIRKHEVSVYGRRFLLDLLVQQRNANQTVKGSVSSVLISNADSVARTAIETKQRIITLTAQLAEMQAHIAELESKAGKVKHAK